MGVLFAHGRLLSRRITQMNRQGRHGQESRALRTPPLSCSMRRRWLSAAAAARAAPAKKKAAKAKAKVTAAARSKTRSLEDIYQRKTPIEHVLLRPGMYVGSVAPTVEDAWCWDADAGQFVHEPQLESIPGLVKIFDEILVNAADNRQRDPKGTTEVRVDIDARAGRITVENNGKGIPVRLHKGEGMYFPTLVLGHVLTGSNFADGAEGTGLGGGGAGGGGAGGGGKRGRGRPSKAAAAAAKAAARLTGGAHGYGAKLTNILSREFTVETADTREGLLFRQTWRNNMREVGEPEIAPLGDGAAARGDFTRVSFVPDLARFGLPDGATLADAPGALALMRKRVVDVAGCATGPAVPGGPGPCKLLNAAGPSTGDTQVSGSWGV